MAVSLKESGTEVVTDSEGLSISFSVPFPTTSTTDDINILTVATQPVEATVATPTGWVRVIEGVSSDEVEEWLTTIFARKGHVTGSQSVTVTRTVTSGTIRGAIDCYQRTTGKVWYWTGHQDDYTYLDVYGDPKTGTGVFVTLDEKSPIITVDFNELVHSPGYSIDITGATGYDTVKIYATDPTGSYADILVRSGDRFILSGTASAVDYEFANFDNIIYRADFFIDDHFYDSLYSSEITEEIRDWLETNSYSPALNSWLRSVDVPELSIPCFISDNSQRSRKGRILSRNAVLGQKYDIITTDVFNGREGTLTIYTGGYPEFSEFNGDPEDVDLIIDKGDVLLLSHLDSVLLHETPTYMIVTDLKRTRQGVYDQCAFKFEITYVEVDRPDPAGVRGGTTWQMVLDNNLSWQMVLNTHATWLDVLLRP